MIEEQNFSINNNIEFLKKFWVGLMDGDGSIQVNHWRKTSLQFRLVIKLKYNLSNKRMLELFASNFTGKINLVNKNTFIIWAVNDKKSVIEMIKIFNFYPPLTSRMICRLEFLKKCLKLNKNDIESYLKDRDLKYKDQLKIIFLKKNNFNNFPDYFNVWISGFIEAEGCFCLRKNKNHSFSIGQKNDKYILEYIRSFFLVTSNVRSLKNDFYFLEVYKREVLFNFINHFEKFPLLGDKLDSFEKFKKIIIAKN